MKLNVIDHQGEVNVFAICKLAYLLLLASISLLTAMAINDLVQKVLEKYYRKDGSTTGYLIYALVMVILLIGLVFIGCHCSPDIVSYIDLSPF